MSKKYFVLGFTLFLCLTVSSAFAQAEKEEYKKRLREVRQEKARLNMGYKKDVQTVKNAQNDQLTDIKKDFHAKRDTCINMAKDKEGKITEAYKKQLEPLLQEEKNLTELIGPEATSNFAKTKR